MQIVQPGFKQGAVNRRQASFLFGGRAGIMIQDYIGKTRADFKIGKSQQVACPRADAYFFLYGQISALKQQRFRFDILDLKTSQESFAGFETFKRGNIVLVFLQQLDQKRGRAAFKPVVSEPAAIQIKQDIKGIVNRLPQKIVTIVPVLDTLPSEASAKEGCLLLVV